MTPLEKTYIAGYDKYPTDSRYYKISLKQDTGGDNYLSVFTHYSDNYQKRSEVREASLVKAAQLQNKFRTILKQNISVLDEPNELKVFLSVGGHALINFDLVQKHWLDLLKPWTCLKNDLNGGFIDEASWKAKFTQRHAQGQNRMQVLQRDGFRCRICGTHADDNPDVRLHTHHIQPWG